MIRIYFNKASESPLVWSVDHGPGTEEVKFRKVVSGVLGTTKENLSEPDSDKPKAWIEFHWCHLERREDTGIIYYGLDGPDPDNIIAATSPLSPTKE